MQRVACTPLETADGPRLRIAGMMEFRRPDAALDQGRIQAIVDAVRPLLEGVDLDHRTDEWVGSRPVTTDGLPLIGATAASRVFVAGGHGMWGIALGPVTGQLLADRIVSGVTPAELVGSTRCGEVDSTSARRSVPCSHADLDRGRLPETAMSSGLRNGPVSG